MVNEPAKRPKRGCCCRRRVVAPLSLDPADVLRTSPLAVNTSLVNLDQPGHVDVEAGGTAMVTGPPQSPGVYRSPARAGSPGDRRLPGTGPPSPPPSRRKMNRKQRGVLAMKDGAVKSEDVDATEFNFQATPDGPGRTRVVAVASPKKKALDVALTEGAFCLHRVCRCLPNMTLSRHCHFRSCRVALAVM